MSSFQTQTTQEEIGYLRARCNNAIKQYTESVTLAETTTPSLGGIYLIAIEEDFWDIVKTIDNLGVTSNFETDDILTCVARKYRNRDWVLTEEDQSFLQELAGKHKEHMSCFISSALEVGSCASAEFLRQCGIAVQINPAWLHYTMFQALTDYGRRKPSRENKAIFLRRWSDVQSYLEQIKTPPENEPMARLLSRYNVLEQELETCGQKICDHISAQRQLTDSSDTIVKALEKHY